MSEQSTVGLGDVEQTATYRELFRNRSYRDLFWAMLTSSLGDWIGLFAILALTESILGATRAAAFALSGVMIARVVPTLALGPVAGVFVDRWDRKRTMIFTDLGRGVVMGLIAFTGDIFQLVVATFLIEVMSTLFIPAKDATIPNVVERRRLVQANQLSLMVTYGTLPLGAAAFALLTGFANTFLEALPLLGDRPIALAILFNAATFFVSAGFIARIDVPSNGRRRQRGVSRTEQQQGAWSELVEGFRFIWRQPLVRALVGGVMAAFLAAGVVFSVGKLFTTIVNAGDTGFGVLGAVVGAGLFAGLVLSGPLSARLDKERLFAPGIAVGGGGLVAAALMPRLDLATLPAFVMGMGAGVSFIVGYTMLQELSADEVRGRTFAAFNTGVRAALFVSLVVGPALVGIIGVEQPGPGGVYGYTIGGVRITLILAGLVALGGAVYTGRAIHQVLTSRIGLDDGGATRATRTAGYLVAFEGGEGAGKSTQIGRLRDAIEGAGYDVHVTREPGGTPLGEELRHLLLDPRMPDVGERAEALLYAAARAQHADEVLRPRLSRGTVVLCDRYIDSSIVYQGGVRGLGEAQIEELNRWATDDLEPDLVVLLDVEAEEGLRRVGARDGSGDGPVDRLEGEGLDFHRSVNEAFRKRAAAHPERYLVVDATRAPEELERDIRKAVLERLQEAERERGATSLHADTVQMPAPDEEGHGGD